MAWHQWLGLALVVSAFVAAASIVHWTLRTGIAPMPSSRAACRAMLGVAATVPDAPLVELGSGWGSLALRAGRMFPGRTVIGYELSWLPWLVSRVLCRLLRLHNVVLLRRDFLQAEWPPGSVLVCYLFPGGMQRLAAALQHTRSMPAMLISNTFALPGRTADEQIRLGDLYRTEVYVYRWVRRYGLAGSCLMTTPACLSGPACASKCGR